MQEIWKTVPFDPRYEVSNLGRVRNGGTGYVKKLTKRHGTFTNPREFGENNHKAKLTSDKVRAARHAYETTDISKRALARQYGVSLPAMSAVLSRKHWAHVV